MSNSNLDQNYVESIRQYKNELTRDMQRLEEICYSLRNGYDAVKEALNDDRLKKYFTDDFEKFLNEVREQRALAANELVPWLTRYANQLEDLLNRR